MAKTRSERINELYKSSSNMTNNSRQSRIDELYERQKATVPERVSKPLIQKDNEKKADSVARQQKPVQSNKLTKGASGRRTTSDKRVQLGTLAERKGEQAVRQDRVMDAIKGTGKSLAGSYGSAIGTTMQSVNPLELTKSLTKPGGIGNLVRDTVMGDIRNNGDSYSDAVFKNAGRQLTKKSDELIQSGSKDIDKAKDGLGKVGQFAVDVGTQGLMMGSDALLNIIAPGAGMMGFYGRAAGASASEARREGADEDQQLLYGAASGLMELGLERLFSAGKYLKGMYGQGALDMATPMASRVATSNLVKGIVKSPQGQELVYQLAKAGFAMNEEGIEEALADLISPLLKRAVYADEIDMPSMGEVMYDYLLGAASGGLFGAAGTVADYKSGVGRMNQMQENGTMAEDMINRAAVQGEKTSAGQFAQQLSAQRDSGKEVLGGQLNDLQRMTAPEQLKHETELMRQKEEADRKRMAGDVSKFNRTGTERENRAIVEISSGFVKDKVSDVEKIVAENADLSVTLSGDSATFEAVAKVATGTATADDIDRILMKPAAKALVKEYTGVSLPVENTAARKSLENLVVFTGAEHRTEILTKAKARVAEDMASSLGARGSAKFTEMYPNVNEQDNEKFYTVFKRFYNAGEYSMPIETVSKLVDDMGGEYQEVVDRYFTPEVRTAIHKAGFADSKVETANNEESVVRHKNLAQRTKKGTFEDRSTPGKLTKPMKRALTSLAKRTGVNIVFKDTLSDGKGGESNGYYVLEEGTIYLAANSSNPLITVAKHELTHYLKQYAPKEYQELEDFVFTELDGKTNVEKKIEQKIRQYARRGHHLTRSGAKEEILADMAEAFFTDESAIDRVIAYSKELGEAILDGIRTILDTFLAIAGADDNKHNNEYGKILDEIGILRDAERLWMKALQASLKNDVVGNNRKVMNSLKNSEGNALTQAQQSYFKDSVVRDENGNLEVVYHGSANGGDFTIFDGNKLSNESRLSQIGQGFYFTNVKKEAQAYMSNMDIYGNASAGRASKLFEVYLDIKKPFYLGKDELNLKQVEAILMEGNKSWMFDSGIPHELQNREIEGKQYTKDELKALSKEEKVHLYVAYQAKLGTKNVLSNMTKFYAYGEQGKLLESMRKHFDFDGIIDEFADGKKQYSVFSSEQIKAIDNTNPTSNPDIRYSLKDSEGNNLSKAQQEYFAESKIRDEDGNLRVVYHGSAESFTVFDRTKGRANMDIQGMFFSPWEDDAMGYGENVQAYYLNIKNPASESVGYKALRKFQGQNNAGVKARDYLESLGYDGVNNGDEEFIAFRPEQIKLISNQNPTKNDDVRYSMKEEDWLKEEGWLDDDEILLEFMDDYTFEEVVEEAPKQKGPRYKEEKNKNGKVAKFTQERIDALIEDSGAGSDPKYARRYITSIHPRDFLSLTLEDEVFEQWDKAADAGTDNRMYKLDVDKLKSNKTPYLRIDEETGRVEGHEGRHRMRALLEAGVTSVPIAIENLNTKYTKKYHSYMVLNAQDFGDGPVNDDAHAVVLDLLPVNEANRTDIELWYGGKGDIKFSVKEDADTDKIGTYIENGTIKHQFKGELQAAPRSVVEYKGVKDKLGKKEISLRDLRNNWLKKNGMQNQVAPLDSMMDQLMKYIEEDALQRYKYIGLADVVDAKIKYRVDKKGRPSSVVISAMVKNAEYPINFDFTSVCKKRLAMQRVIEHLVSENGEKDVLYNEFDLSAGQVHEINKVLASYGFETACPICFVEARRYYNQAYADKAISIWNGILEKYEPNAEYFNLAEADADFFDYDEIREAFKAFDITKKGMRSYPDKVDALFRAHPYFRKKLRVSDLLSTKGIETMRALKKEGADDLGLLGIIKGSRGASVAKEVTAFTAYNGEIGMLSEKVGKQKRTMRDYLFEIGGVRMQSFSDFLIANVFDYIQLIGDLAARKFPAHAYTKEIIFAKLFGLTGMKINLSAVCDVDPNVPDEYAGLKQNEYGEWEYNIGEQSINMDEAIELVNTEGYSRNVSIIMVGMSDEHIWKMLDDKNIGYIIPYHKSNLPEVIGATSHLKKARDYTDYQGTMILKGIKDGDRGIEYDFAAKYEKLGSWRAVMEEFNAEVKANGWTVETNKIGDGTGDFDTYEALTRMSPAEVADAYIGDCLTNGKMPIFYEFAGHENYYKMGCFDYGVVDLVTGETTIQGEVKNIYPGIDITKGETDASELIEMIDQEMSRMDSFNEVQEGKYADAIAEIKENLSHHMRDAETAEPKYQLKEGPSYDRRVETLEERVAYLKSEMKKTGLKTPVEKDTKVQASKLLKKYDSNMVLHTKLVDTMKDIFKIYKTADGDWYEAYDKAEKMARRIVDKIAILHDEKWQEYKELREYLKKTPIAISEADKQVMGHYGDFYKANRGRMKLVNGAKSNVSDYYSKLVERWPEKFTDDYTDFIDQLHHIEDVLDSLAPWYEHYSSRQMQALVTEIAEDIMVTTGELATRKTFADRKAEEKERAVDRVKRQRDAAMERMKERYDEKLIRQQKTSKEKMDAYKEKQKDKASRKKAMDRIQKNFDWLRERLLNPSDASHIPEGYRAAVAELLEGFDFETDRTDAYEAKNGASKKVIRLRAFKDRFRQIMESPEGEAIELDPDFMAYMDEITDQIDGRRLSELDNVTLENVGLLLKQIKHQMSYINKCFNDEISEGIHELGESTIWEANEQKEAKEYTSVKMHVNKLLNESMVTPADMFELIGGAQKKLYQAMRNGFDRHVQNVQMAIQFTQSTIGDAKVKDWSQNKHTFTLESGKVEMTTTQLMTLYALMQREQAQGHILGSGIVMAPVELKVGKLKAKQKMAETHVMPTLEEVLEMVGVLTDEQKRIADEMRGFLSNECSEWGNRTSMKLYGYKKFTEKDYFPIKSSDSFLNENFDQKNVETSLKSMGFTKAVVREASNPIVIDDFFTVFTDHVNKMSMYEALVPAMTDFQRVYNYKQKADGKQVDSVQKALKRAYGTSATSYIKQFMEDLNGSQRTRNDATIATSMISTYKKASIGGNLRVLLQQPTSLVRAFAVINPKYFSNTPATKKDIAEMKEHCSIAQWKSYGFYNTDVARDMKDIMMGESNLVDDVFMGTYGKADDWTWANIWKAVKKEVEAKNPNLKKGSDEYWQKVNERASYVYDRTQVVDSVFHRSQIMRNKGTFEKMATSFMAEPTKTYNLLRTEIITAKRELTEGKKKEATKRVSGILGVYLLANMTTAMAAAIADAMRGAGGDDEEDKGNFGQRWWAHSIANFKDNANPLNMIPFAKDVVSMYSGYSVERMDMQGISKLLKVQSMWEGLADGTSKYTYGHVIRTTAETMSYFTGVPVKNFLRDVEGITKTVAEAFGAGTAVKYQVAKWTYTLSEDSKNRATFADMYYDALAEGDQALANEILRYMRSQGVTEKYIKNRKKTWSEHNTK